MDRVNYKSSKNSNNSEEFCENNKKVCEKLLRSPYPIVSKYFQNEEAKQSNTDEISDIEIIFENVTQTPKMESLNDNRTPSPIPMKNLKDACDKNPLKAVRRLKFDCNEQKVPSRNNCTQSESKLKTKKRKCIVNDNESQKKVILPGGLNDNAYPQENVFKGKNVRYKTCNEHVLLTPQNDKRNSLCSNSSENSEVCSNDVVNNKTQGKINPSPKKRERNNFIPRKNLQALKRTGMYQNLSQVSSRMLNYNKSFRRSKSDPFQYSNSQRLESPKSELLVNCSLSQSSTKSESFSSSQDSIITENVGTTLSMSQKSDSSTFSLSESSGTLFDTSKKISSQGGIQSTVSPNLFEDTRNSSMHKNSDMWKSRYRHEKGIYLENFHRIIKGTLFSKNLELFNSNEQQLINGFGDISHTGQKLYVRLFLRKIGWIRKSKLNYPEICNIDDLDSIIDELYSSKYVLKATCMDLSEMLSVLTLPEVRQLARDVEVKCSGTKTMIMKNLIKYSKTEEDGYDTILKRALVVLGTCCKLNVDVYKIFMRILILHFLPRFQCEDEGGGPQANLPSLLLLNMNNMKFPNYQVCRARDIFRFREDLISLEMVKELESNIRQCMENKEWKKALEYCKDAKDLYTKSVAEKELRDFEISLPSFLRLYTATSTLVFILNLLVDVLQALRKYQAAMNQLHELLSQKTHLQDFRGHWYNRLALNLHRHLNKPDQALLIIHVALNETEISSPHKLLLLQRAICIGQQYSHLMRPELKKIPKHLVWPIPINTIQGRSPERCKSGNKRKYISADTNWEEFSVEQFAKEHYKKKGYPEGLHGENVIANSLFGLLFWDIVYGASVPDAFRSQEQVAPLDLDTPHFYASRKELIDTRLSLMSTWDEAMVQKELERIWQQNVGQDSLVAWYLFKNLNFLKGLVLSLGINTVTAICERLSKDHRFSKTGFPDLIVWNPSKKISRIVEVKGPGDNLSANQSIWMDYLIDNNAAVEVCHVKDISQRPAKKKRSIKLEKDYSQVP